MWRLEKAAGLVGLVRTSHEGSEAAAPPVLEGCRPRRSDVCAGIRAARPLPLRVSVSVSNPHGGPPASAARCAWEQGQRGRCPSSTVLLVAGSGNIADANTRAYCAAQCSFSGEFAARLCPMFAYTAARVSMPPLHVFQVAYDLSVRYVPLLPTISRLLCFCAR